MRTVDGCPNIVYLNSCEYMFYATAKRTIAYLDECIKLAKTAEQKLELFKRRNELSRNYDAMIKLIGNRKVEVC